VAEELILWSSSEFNMIRLQNEFTSGSSIMPQKRNPDVAEIIRGERRTHLWKSGSLVDDPQRAAAFLQSRPQEDKPPFFDTVDTLQGCLAVPAPMIATMVRARRPHAPIVDRGF